LKIDEKERKKAAAMVADVDDDAEIMMIDGKSIGLLRALPAFASFCASSLQ